MPHVCFELFNLKITYYKCVRTVHTVRHCTCTMCRSMCTAAKNFANYNLWWKYFFSFTKLKTWQENIFHENFEFKRRICYSFSLHFINKFIERNNAYHVEYVDSYKNIGRSTYLLFTSEELVLVCGVVA